MIQVKYEGNQAADKYLGEIPNYTLVRDYYSRGTDNKSGSNKAFAKHNSINCLYEA